MDYQTQQAILAKTMEIAVEKILEAETQLDEAIEHYDNMSQDEIADLRKRRRLQLESSQKKKLANLALGHGKYTEIHDQHEWFEVCKASELVLTHFYRPTTAYCDLLDRHLEKLCADHLETRFIKVNAEKASYLADKLLIRVMPTIILTKNNKIIDTIEGFTDLGDTDQFTTETLELRLGKKGGINFTEDDIKRRKLLQQQQQAEVQAVRQSDMHSARAKLVSTLDDDDDWLNED